MKGEFSFHPSLEMVFYFLLALECILFHRPLNMGCLNLIRSRHEPRSASEPELGKTTRKSVARPSL